MPVTQNTLFPGNTIIADSKKHQGIKSTGATVDLIQLLSDMATVGQAGIPFKAPSAVLINLVAAGGGSIGGDTTSFIFNANAQTGVLPNPALHIGRTIWIKNSSTNYANTVSTAAGTIDGRATFYLEYQGAGICVQSDGTDWNIVGAVGNQFPYPTRQGGSATLNADDYTYIVTSSSQTITLPGPGVAGIAGRVFSIKNAAGVTGTSVVVTGGGSIDGSASLALSDSLDACIVQSDNSEYKILSNYNTASVIIPSSVPQWVKTTWSYTAWQGGGGGGTTATRTIYTLPAGGVIHAAKLKTSYAFAGGTITTADMGIQESGGSYLDILPAFDVAQAPGNAVLALSSVVTTYDQVSTTAIDASLTVAGGIINDMTTGDVDIWLLVSVAV